jgi:hypothetical protein
MDSIDTKVVKNIWKQKGKKLKKPKIFFATFFDKVYYVFRDDSFIIFMIPSKCDVTYAVPKKYCKVQVSSEGEEYYKIENSDSISVVSCIGRKSTYEKLILDNVITDPSC